MSMTLLATVSEQVQKYWAPMFMKELRESTLLPSLVNRDYDGEIKQGGDTVYVSQVNAPTGEMLTTGTNEDAFNPEALSTSRISVVANKRAVASFKFNDLVDLQSQIGAENSAIRDALMFAVMKQLNDYLYSLVSPSTSAPDHVLNSVSALDATQLIAVRTLAGQAKWLKDGKWYGLIDPSYWGDILAAQTLTSSDYVGGEQPVIGGQLANRRFGFNLLEDNSLGTDKALFFHSDFMHLCTQKAPVFKISDLHPNQQFGYVISCDMIFGAALGISGNVKHISVVAAASGLANS